MLAAEQLHFQSPVIISKPYEVEINGQGIKTSGAIKCPSDSMPIFKCNSLVMLSGNAHSNCFQFVFDFIL